MFNPSTPGSGADNLPPDLLLLVFSYLNSNDLVSCSNVCNSWRKVAFDAYIWQRKLVDLLKTRWSTIICDEQPEYRPDFQHIHTTHPFKIYQFLIHYIPSHLLAEQNDSGPLSDGIKGLNGFDDIAPMNEDSSTHRLSFGELIWHWWINFRRKLSINSNYRLNSQSRKRCRFAVFGPGFDQRATSCLFSKLVDVRTKSFEPINMIPGRMGFGAGLTLRLYNQAQIAALDSSMKVNKDRWSDVKVNSSKFCSKITVPSSDNSVTTEEDILEDFVFDLHYLYSLSGHLSDNFTNQIERIQFSRLFNHPDLADNSSSDSFFENLRVSDDMKCLLKGLCGLIYALDARESVEQAHHLHFELKTVLDGLPDDIASKIPIVILYIMPKENIIPKKSHRMKNKLVFSEEPKAANIMNRDSYSGADYTISWRGSLLLPLSCLNLFQFKNPWRLQKCASNDIKAVIQSFMWLRTRHPFTPNPSLSQMIRANSAL